VITISPRPVGRNCGTISFASTLYLCPILDLLLAEIPYRWHPELRLGLQEALVNAAKHGNNLDPGKIVIVRFTLADDHYWWAISDEGCGFTPPCKADQTPLNTCLLKNQKAVAACVFSTKFLIRFTGTKRVQS
jgi:anti-sigma regulatory factor (Ser/Thr protein kinase)